MSGGGLGAGGGGNKRTWTVIHTSWSWFQILPVYNNTRNVFIVIYVRCVRDKAYTALFFPLV